MHFNLAVVTIIVCIAVMGTSGQNKKVKCCTEVSVENINAPITGFQLQKKNLPCVKAVIFFTTEGPKCSHWRESWVVEKVRELRKLQTIEKSVNLTTSIAPQTTDSY